MFDPSRGDKRHKLPLESETTREAMLFFSLQCQITVKLTDSYFPPARLLDQSSERHNVSDEAQRIESTSRKDCYGKNISKRCFWDG